MTSQTCFPLLLLVKFSDQSNDLLLRNVLRVTFNRNDNFPINYYFGSLRIPCYGKIRNDLFEQCRCLINSFIVRLVRFIVIQTRKFKFQ